MQVHDMSLWIQSQIWESRNLQSLGSPVSSHQVIQQVRRSIYSLAFPNHICTLHLQMYCLNTGRKVVAKHKVPSNMLLNLTCQILTLVDMSQACCLEPVIWLSLFYQAKVTSVKEVGPESNFLQIHLKLRSQYILLLGDVLYHTETSSKVQVLPDQMQIFLIHALLQCISIVKWLRLLYLSPSAPLNSTCKLEKSSKHFDSIWVTV